MNLLSEVTDNTATDCEIGAKHLSKMGLKENSEGKWVMASECEEEEGEETPAPVPAHAPAPVSASASATMPSSGTAFEKAVMERLDQILRSQKELSVQMRCVEERVTSLEKKLTFVDLNMEDPVRPTHGASPTHEPQQHSPTEHIIPDSAPMAESAPASEPHIDDTVPTPADVVLTEVRIGFVDLDLQFAQMELKAHFFMIFDVL